MKNYLYLAPFSATPESFSDKERFTEILEEGKKRKIDSLDSIPLRYHWFSGELGFTKLILQYSYYDGDDLINDLLKIMGHLGTPGGRGQREVILNTEYTSDVDLFEDSVTYRFEIWVGSDIWHNKHRVIAGIPGHQDEYIQIVLDNIIRSLESHKFYNVQVQTWGQIEEMVERMIAESVSNDISHIRGWLTDIGEGRSPVSEIQTVIDLLSTNLGILTRKSEVL